jgi:metallo-beta-lactamase class B
MPKMRVIAVLCVLGVIFGPGVAAGQAALTITHLTGDFYVYTTYRVLGDERFPSNSLYLVTDSGVVMIDTPWDSTQFRPLMDSIWARHHQKVVLCISTHFHDDRTIGLNFLKVGGVRTYSSSLTRNYCRENGNPMAEFVFTGDTTFIVGQHRFQTYFPGEGHTKDNIVVWFGKERILYGGCLVKSTEATDLGYTKDGNLSAYPATIMRLKRTFPDPRFVITGHQSWADTGSLDHTLVLLKAAGYTAP